MVGPDSYCPFTCEDCGASELSTHYNNKCRYCYMKNREKNLCKGKTINRYFPYSRSACSNYAVRDGYCGTHHPDSIAKRKSKSEARFLAEEEKRETIEKERYANQCETLMALQTLLSAISQSDVTIDFELNQAIIIAERALSTKLATGDNHEQR